MERWINVLALIGLLGFVGYGFWQLMRWSRSENARFLEQSKEATTSERDFFMREQRQRSWRGFFAASLTRTQARVGRGLVVAIVVFVLCTLIFLVVLRVLNSK